VLLGQDVCHCHWGRLLVWLFLVAGSKFGLLVGSFPAVISQLKRLPVGLEIGLLGFCVGCLWLFVV